VAPITGGVIIHFMSHIRGIALRKLVYYYYYYYYVADYDYAPIPVAARPKACVCGCLLACWDCSFESRWRHGWLSPVSVAFCQVEVSASGWSLVQSSPTETEREREIVCVCVCVSVCACARASLQSRATITSTPTVSR
jgi:hypothetical protein